MMVSFFFHFIFLKSATLKKIMVLTMVMWEDKEGESFLLKVKRPFKTAGEGGRQIIVIVMMMMTPMLVFLWRSTRLGACQGQP